MSRFFDDLQAATSEEDVKDVYIRELELKGYKKGKIDLQTDEIWFEAKTGGNVSYYEMFTQLLHYVYDADAKGEQIPPVLGVIDQQKAALMRTVDVLPLLRDGNIKWGSAAGKFTQETLDDVSRYIGVYFVSYDIETQSNLFMQTFRSVIKDNEFIRTQITPDNLKQVFDTWMDMIGREITNIKNEADYSLLFFADIMTDGDTSTHKNLSAELLRRAGKPVFSFKGKICELSDTDGYDKFWRIYHRPPDKAYQNYLLERRDSLLPLDERMFKGAYYTSLTIVDKAYNTLTKTLGANWQKEYIVWDMSCGVGNLEVKHSNHRNVFMSTLDEADVELMHSSAGICVAAERFQYDYLNDDITDEGEIDYSITNKIPQKLREAIKEGKKILVLMNPPYAEAMNANLQDSSISKTGVATTRVASAMGETGYASRELYTQFLTRIAKEIPNATIAMFSKLKYINAPNFEKFRQTWHAKYLGGFIVHSKAFEGLRGDFPIGFLIWDTDPEVHKNMPIGNITAEVIDRFAVPIGTKTFYPISKDLLMGNWVKRPKPNNIDALPLSNALSPTTRTRDVRGRKWADGAIGGIFCNGSDLQHAGATAIFSSGFSSAGGFLITKENLAKVAMIFTVRRIIKHTWINDRDQFLIPTGELTDEFKNDCLFWMLFNNSNLTASADGLEWNDKKWSLVNHFIPFSEAEVNVTKPFESDFMMRYLEGKELSPEAEAVKDAGRGLWQIYFSKTYPHAIRTKYKLGRPDVGWYQVRNALKENNKNMDTGKTRFTVFEDSYKILSDKLRPQIFELGFLMR